MLSKYYFLYPFPSGKCISYPSDLNIYAIFHNSSKTTLNYYLRISIIALVVLCCNLYFNFHLF